MEDKQTVKIITMESGKQAIASVTPMIDVTLRTFDDAPVSEQTVDITPARVEELLEKASTHDIIIDTMNSNITITPKDADDMPTQAQAKEPKEVNDLSGRVAA